MDRALSLDSDGLCHFGLVRVVLITAIGTFSGRIHRVIRCVGAQGPDLIIDATG